MAAFKAEMKKPKVWLAALGVGLSLATFTVLLYAGHGKPVVSVETIERREVPIVKEYAAQLQAAATVEIRANVEG